MYSGWRRRTSRPSFFIDEVDAIATARFDAQTGADRCMASLVTACDRGPSVSRCLLAFPS